jgi:hypothetical protein
MAKFEEKRDGLYIDEHKVLRAWESFTGWYWFATEKVEDRKPGVDGGGSMIDGKEVDDVIWFGLVQGIEEEWGEFIQAEIESLGRMHVWELKGGGLLCAGRRG